MRRVPLLLAAFIFSTTVGVIAAVPDTVDAHHRTHNSRCPHVYDYQHGWGGIYTTTGMNFRSSDICNGRHVKQGYVRVKQTGPKWRCQPWRDSSRRYTGTTSAHNDSWNWAHIGSVQDATLWGCSLGTYYDWWYY